MTTTVSNTVAASQVATWSADSLRASDSYQELLARVGETELTITEAKLEAGDYILVWLQRQLEGLTGEARDTARAVLVATLAQDCGYSRPDISALVKSVVLRNWLLVSVGKWL